MTEQATTAGDVKILALAVKALIDTHPDKKAFHALFLGYVDHPERAGAYTAGLGEMSQDRTLLQSLLQSATKG